MGKLVLSDVQTATFNNGRTVIDFDAQILDWADSRKYRLAGHQYLKRDGAEQEYMGREPHRVKFNIVYIGANWRKDFLNFVAAIDDNPKGTLTHPFFSKMNVACEGFDGAKVVVESGIDTVIVPVSFIEDNLNQKLQSVAVFKSPAGCQQDVATYSAALTLASSIYVKASVAIALFNATANAYALAAVASTLTTGLLDATLPNQLANVVLNAKAARDAIRADPLATSDAASFPSIILIEQVLDACEQLDDSIKIIKPTLLQFVVPSQMSLLSIAQIFYGRDAMTRLDEIRINNPGKIPNPAAIAPATILNMAPPTVKQFGT